MYDCSVCALIGCADQWTNLPEPGQVKWISLLNISLTANESHIKGKKQKTYALVYLLFGHNEIFFLCDRVFSKTYQKPRTYCPSWPLSFSVLNTSARINRKYCLLEATVPSCFKKYSGPQFVLSSKIWKSLLCSAAEHVKENVEKSDGTNKEFEPFWMGFFESKKDVA